MTDKHRPAPSAVEPAPEYTRHDEENDNSGRSWPAPEAVSSEGEAFGAMLQTRELMLAGLASHTPEQPDSRFGAGEVGWLVESHANGPLYHQVGGATTRNAADALRFSRQQDAEAFIRAYGPNHYDSISTPAWKAVEHRWG